jgi:hypothetical protein
MLELMRTSLVLPVDGSGDMCAERIAQTLREQCDVDLPIAPGDRAIETRHAIALGCLADNPFIEQLYLRWQTLVDRWYPGTGGYAMQMVTRPSRIEGCALVLGSNDPQGMVAATEAFLRIVEEHPDGRIPWVLEVELGKGHRPLPEDRIDTLGTSTGPVSTPESALPEEQYQSGFRGGSARDYLLRLGMYGPHADNAHFSRSSQLGLRYLYTGDLEDARQYRRALLGEIESGVVRRLYHYKSIRMFQLWELLAPCPVFSATERKTVTAAILEYLEEESGLVNAEKIRTAADGPGIFDRHTACEALNLWIGADFFWRETGDKVWLERRGIADLFFVGQAGTDVPITGLTEGYASYLEVYLEWMLWNCPERIRADAHVRLWARRVLGLCTNAGLLVAGPQTGGERYPYQLLRKLALLLDDGGYLFVAEGRERQVQLGNDRVMQFSAGQAYAGKVESRRPDEETGVILFPANERLRRWKATSISADRGFDRVVGRGGWEVGDDYWMAVGMRSGGKCQPNVGCLAAYERFGKGLITAEANFLYPGSASPWRHSGITVSVGGLGGGMAEGAEAMVRRSARGGELLAYQVRIEGMYRWVRSIFWMPAAYMLIVDRVEVVRDGEFTVGINWRCGMEMESEGNLARGAFVTEEGENGTFWVETAPDLEFLAEENSYPALGAPLGTPPARELLLHALTDGCGEEIEVATLLHAELGAELPVYRLGKNGETWTVDGGGEILEFRSVDAGDLEVKNRESIDKPTNKPSASSEAADPLQTCWEHTLASAPTVWDCSGENLVVGTQRGEIVAMGRGGETAWSARCDAAVTALARNGADLIAGTESGEVLRFDGKGQVRWRHQCRFRDERTFWPWWFLETPQIGALAAGCEPRSGREIVAAGTGGTSLNFLDAETGVPIADRISGYGLPDRIVAYTDPEKERLFFLIGHSWLSCESTVWAWAADELERPLRSYCDSVEPMGRLTSGWDTCAARNFWAGSWTAGEERQLVVLRHGAVNQLTAYDIESTRPIWDVGLGGAPVDMAVITGGTATTARIHVADECGWWVVFDGNGKRVSGRRVARRLEGMHADTAGDLFLWNQELLLQGNEGGIDRRYELIACPLGWCELGEEQGLLGIDGDLLVLQGSEFGPNHID